MRIFASAKQIAGMSMHKLYLDNNGTLVSRCYDGEREGEENDEEDMEVNNEKEENDNGNVKDNKGNETTSSSSVSSPSASLQDMDIAKVKIGEWVVVQYEGEHFIGKVTDTLINKECKAARVCCLKRPYGLKEPSDMESENHVVYYKTIYKCNNVSTIINHKRGWKYIY